MGGSRDHLFLALFFFLAWVATLSRKLKITAIAILLTDLAGSGLRQALDEAHLQIAGKMACYSSKADFITETCVRTEHVPSRHKLGKFPMSRCG